MRDLYRNVLVTQHLAPVVSTVTRTSTSIDMQGYNSVSAIVSLGLAGDTLSASVYWTLKLQHSDDDSSYSDVATADVYNGNTNFVVNSPSLDRNVYQFGYLGSKRYLKLVATPTGTHSVGTPIGMISLRGTPAYAPVV